MPWQDRENLSSTTTRTHTATSFWEARKTQSTLTVPSVKPPPKKLLGFLCDEAHHERLRPSRHRQNTPESRCTTLCNTTARSCLSHLVFRSSPAPPKKDAHDFDEADPSRRPVCGHHESDERERAGGGFSFIFFFFSRTRVFFVPFSSPFLLSVPFSRPLTVARSGRRVRVRVQNLRSTTTVGRSPAFFFALGIASHRIASHGRRGGSFGPIPMDLSTSHPSPAVHRRAWHVLTVYSRNVTVPKEQ